MPPKRTFFEMSGDAAKIEAHPLDLIKEAIEVHEKIVRHKNQAIQKAEKSILRNQLKIEEYQSKIEELKKLNIKLGDEHAEAKEFVRKADEDGRELKAIKKRGEELEKELLDIVKKEFADQMQDVLQEAENLGNQCESHRAPRITIYNSNLQAAIMEPNNNEVAGKIAGQMSGSKVLKADTQQSTQFTNTIAQTQHAIREHQKQIEDFRIKIQKHVQKIAALRQEEQALLKEQTRFEVERLHRELCDVDKENKQREVEEKKYKDMMAKQILIHEILYEGEF
ncbi:hypothetical protein BCON_0418g00060 [Botryotinia convoluta]|uniref:Uncharacterized protein n=1 Tax=Botryotinia convoluta TaxID=54673 RepID=A0A4Z1HJC8_9HELO|nr:hypothetical protein BCON_0418g00060 [Botryotinia convoluta]